MLMSRNATVREQSVSHLSGVFSFRIGSDELRGDFRNRGFVVTSRRGGRGSRGRRRLGGQLGRRHVLIEVSVLIVHVLVQLAPPCGGAGVQRLRFLELDHTSMQTR